MVLVRMQSFLQQQDYWFNSSVSIAATIPIKIAGTRRQYTIRNHSAHEMGRISGQYFKNILITR
jgi:hypothetical protein